MLSEIKKRTNNNQDGFTIIEVLIVLAIAGLIMLIVFLAVPALQRNSRNTQRKNDAASISSAIANFISNNGGNLPTSQSTDAADAKSIDLKNTTLGTNYEISKLGYYDTTKVTFGTTAPTTTDAIVIAGGYKCNPSNTAIGAADARSAAVLYMLEPGSVQCVEQ